jgi:hypothetical protein
MQAGLVDELVIYMAPHLMGSAARGLMNLALERMDERIALGSRTSAPWARTGASPRGPGTSEWKDERMAKRLLVTGFF